MLDIMLDIMLVQCRKYLGHKYQSCCCHSCRYPRTIPCSDRLAVVSAAVLATSPIPRFKVREKVRGTVPETALSRATSHHIFSSLTLADIMCIIEILLFGAAIYTCWNTAREASETQWKIMAFTA